MSGVRTTSGRVYYSRDSIAQPVKRVVWSKRATLGTSHKPQRSSKAPLQEKNKIPDNIEKASGENSGMNQSHFSKEEMYQIGGIALASVGLGIGILLWALDGRFEALSTKIDSSVAVLDNKITEMDKRYELRQAEADKRWEQRQAYYEKYIDAKLDKK